MAFALAEAKLVGAFLVTLTYGVYLVSAGLCMRVLLSAEKGRPLRYTLITLVATIFVLATIDVSLCFSEVMRVFAYYKGSKSANEEFENLSSWVNIMETSDIQILSLIGDGILVYRCYVIFARRLAVVLVPAALWLASGAAGIVIVYFTATLHTGDIVSSSRLSHTIIVFLVITLVENLLTTSLIVWRIYCIDRETSQLVALPRKKRSRLANATRIIVESGLLYTIFVLLSLVTELAGNNAAYPVSQMMLVVIGISFNLIIIRVGNGTAVGGTYDAPTMTAAGGNTVIHFAEPMNETQTTVSVASKNPPAGNVETC